MMKYINYSQYCAFDPLLTNEEFESVVQRVCAYLDVVTHNRIAGVFGTQTYKEERAIRAVARLCNVVHQMDNTSRLKSVSNDGYSEAYETVSIEEADEKLYREARLWLSGTGLIGFL